MGLAEFFMIVISLTIIVILTVIIGMFKSLRGYHKYKETGQGTIELELLNNLRIASIINFFLGFAPLFFVSIYAWYRLRSLRKSQPSPSSVQLEMRNVISQIIKILFIPLVISTVISLPLMLI